VHPRRVGDRLEVQAVHAAGGPEHGLQHGFQREVRLDGVAIQSEAFAAQLLGIELAVPGRQPDGGAFSVGDGLVVGDLRERARLDAAPGALQQRQRGGRLACHAVVQRVVRVAFKAEQAGQFAPQLQHLGGHGLVVVRAGAVAAVRPHAPDLFAQVAPGGQRQEGPDRAARVRDGPLVGPALLGGGRRRGLALCFGQAVQPVLVFDEDGLGTGFLDEVLAVARRQFGQPAVDRGQPGLRRVGQPGAAPAHAGEQHLHQPPLLGRQPGALAAFPDGLQTRMEALVVRDLVVQRRQQRRHALGDRGHLSQAHAVGVDRQQARQTPQSVAAVFHRLGGVLE
jgi:hypothetical protein